MSHRIRRVAVLGAGVMGTGIATHLANAGIPSLLFDVVDPGGDRSGLARKALAAASRSKPASLYHPDDVALVTPCNYEDDAAKLATVDWIVEVVVERLDIKKKVFAWVAEHRAPGTVVTSNTSGIKLADMAAGMPEEMRRAFFVTHFFNPVRYMRLLEVVTGPETDPEAVARVVAFGERVLGKGVVYGKDTPNFVANRVGTYGMAATFRHMAEAGLTIEQVDAIFGEAMGRPKSAVFRTADVVGLDTLQHVFRNLHDSLAAQTDAGRPHGAPVDEERAIFVLPDAVDRLLATGRAGAKSGAGFYKKAAGSSDILVLDLATLEYRQAAPVRYESIGKARKQETSGAKLATLVAGSDAAATAAWRVTADTLIYAANRIPEIADDVVNVDRAMRWGFGYDLGPFESWDALGVRASVARMKAEGRAVPAWVEAMLAAGRESFYARDGAGRLTYWKRDGGAELVPTSPGVLLLSDLHAAGSVIERNPSASLHDLGDGVLGLEFHSKMNSLDELIFALYESALNRLDADEFDALVVANQDPRAFSAGANVLMVLMNAMQGNFGLIEQQLDRLQQLLMRAKYHRKPVVTAPHGMTLGGGAEVAMHGAACQAAGELHMGLVEVGIGLIPGAGGCKELVMRTLGDVPQDVDYDPNPFLARVFERIGLAKVTGSAEEARAWGYLRPGDRVTTNSERLLGDAKALALGLVRAGYAPPRRRTVKVPGATGRAAVELFLYQMAEGGYATPHDVTVGKKLAHVITGGDVPWGTVRTEQDLLDLERESFVSLASSAESIARMQHFLQTGKPLRN